MASPSRNGARPVDATLALIAAVARNGVIGANNALPWRLPADLTHFRALTMGHTIVMGRRTWQSLPRALPGRQNVVVSRQPGFTAAGAEVVPSLSAAIDSAKMPSPVFCIGGAAMYLESMPRADVLYMTEIDRDFAGDAFFPAWDRSAWRVSAREEGIAPEGFAFAFTTYLRVHPSP